VKKKSLVDRLKQAYENGKKPFAYIIIFSVFILEVLSNLAIVDNDMAGKIEQTLLVTLSIMMLEVLFQIYEKVVAKKTSLKRIGPNALYDEVLPLIKNSKDVDIKYIGAAGRHGWTPVLAKLLDKNTPDSLHDVHSFHIKMALISPTFYENNKDELTKIDALLPIINDIERVRTQLGVQYPNDERRQFDLDYYDYMPNFTGFLINDNYLFLNMCFWQDADDKTLMFRGGGTDYLIYDMNDEFGGAYYIERFQGWFKYIQQKNQARAEQA
jgi:hypothetical protein